MPPTSFHATKKERPFGRPSWLYVRSAVLGFPVNGKRQRSVFGVNLLFENAAFPILADEASFPRLTASYCGKVRHDVSSVSFPRCQSHFFLSLYIIHTPITVTIDAMVLTMSKISSKLMMHLHQRDGYAKTEERMGLRSFLLWRLLLNQRCDHLDKLGNHCHQSRSKRDLLGQLLAALF